MTRIQKTALILAITFIVGVVVGVLGFDAVKDSLPQKVAVQETYKVKGGDTFWDIAAKYREQDCRNLYILEFLEELKELNPSIAAKKNQLHVGDEMIVRYYVEARP